MRERAHVPVRAGQGSRAHPRGAGSSNSSRVGVVPALLPLALTLYSGCPCSRAAAPSSPALPPRPCPAGHRPRRLACLRGSKQGTASVSRGAALAATSALRWGGGPGFPLPGSPVEGRGRRRLLPATPHAAARLNIRRPIGPRAAVAPTAICFDRPAGPVEEPNGPQDGLGMPVAHPAAASHPFRPPFFAPRCTACTG